VINSVRRIFAARPVAAGVIVSVVTLALIGGVVLSTTSLGCGPAQRIGLKLQRCLVTSPTAALPSPTTSQIPTRSPLPAPSYSPVPPSTNPYPPPASNPYPPPASNPYPNPASGPQPPDGGPASGAYPPFYPPASPGNPIPLALNCRLPIYAGGNGSGGFIVLPGGTWIADPTSTVSVPTPSPGSPSPAPGPGYGNGGFFGLTYDRAHLKWLPVGPSWVTPDGSRYAYPATEGVYVVDVATGVQTEVGDGHAWSVIGVEAAGVYATQVNSAGLWLLPYSGTPTELTAGGFWQVAGASAAYGTLTSAVPQGVATTIIRFQYGTSQPVDWFTRNGAQSNVAGLDLQGNPIIYVSYFTVGGQEVWVATGPSNAIPISGSGQNINIQGSPLADSNGIWFPISWQPGYQQYASAMALYVPGQGFYGMANINGTLAGACL
jgi:hypothetical protein